MIVETKLDPSGWLEVTWLEETVMPDTVIPAEPPVYELLDDGMGNLARGKLLRAGTPEQIIPGEVIRTPIKCTSYHPSQIDMLRADAAQLGTSLDEEFLVGWK